MSYLLALLAGALLPLSLAPYGVWPLGLLAIAGWFHLLYRAERRLWLLGWCFGVGKYAVGASWVYVSINVYGQASPLLAGFLVVVFVAGLAFFTLANAWLFGRLRSGHLLADAITFALVFVGFEWLLTWFLTGFPWLFAGYAHLHGPLSGLAPVGGVLLVSLGVALTATMLVAAWSLRPWGRRPADAMQAAGADARRVEFPLALGLAAAPWVLGAALATIDWVKVQDTREVALVQGNIDQSVKWDPEESARIIRTYVELSEPHWDAGLMIWPEAAITLLEHEAAGLLGDLAARGRAAGTALVLGVPRAERLPGGAVEYHNAALAIGTGSGRYLKRRLVPFGEYVPLEATLRGLIAFFDLPMSGFSPGPWRQPLLDLGGPRAVMAICYEVVYPALVRAQAAEADVLLTLSNDTWFGASAGPLQHLEMAQMRALENGRWMLRSTNNGVTAIIDHRGRMRDRLPQFETAVLRGPYQVMVGVTPYTRFGHGPLAGCALLLVLGVMLLRRRA